ncbi:MAG: hypothetical protein QF440_07350, partial [Candidatus Thalassarchaeaceae archaeon]|nr:hypothetical protein [Candidatus Thalassarchaeaceae archaeon]
MASGALLAKRLPLAILSIIILLFGQSISPLILNDLGGDSETQSREETVWIDGGQAWPQFGQNPNRHSITPPNAPSDQVSTGEYVSITDPVLNWNHYPD